MDGVVRHLDVCLESPNKGFHPVERPNTRQAAGAQLRRRSTVTECWGPTGSSILLGPARRREGDYQDL